MWQWNNEMFRYSSLKTCPLALSLGWNQDAHWQSKAVCLSLHSGTTASHRAMATPCRPQLSTNSHLWVRVLSLCSLFLLGLLYNGTDVSVSAQPFQWGLTLEWVNECWVINCHRSSPHKCQQAPPKPIHFWILCLAPFLVFSGIPDVWKSLPFYSLT